MSQLDYSRGNNVVEIPNDSTVPIKEVGSDRLVPVSKISRYDQPIVLANEYFIAYPTSKQGVIRVIAQKDASHVTLSTGGPKTTLIKDVTMTQLEREQGKTFLAAIVEDVETGKLSIWTWELSNSGDLTKSEEIISHEYCPDFHKQDIVRKIQFIPETGTLLAAYDNEQLGTTPYINQYFVCPKISGHIHQPLYSPVVDFTYMKDLDVVLVLTKDGCLYECGKTSGMKKVNLSTSLSQPRSIVDGSIVLFDKKLAILDGNGGFKCVLNLINILSDNYKLVQYNRQVCIIIDVSSNQLLFVRIDKGMFKDFSTFHFNEIDILDVSVTKNLENTPGVLFDTYIFHSKGLAILQVNNKDLESNNGPIFGKKKPEKGNNQRNKTRKQQQQLSPQLDAPTLEKAVELASERLIASGQFVTKQQLDKVRAEHEKWVYDASQKFEKLLNRFEQLLEGSNISRSSAPSPLGGLPGNKPSSRIPSESGATNPVWQGLRKDSPLGQDLAPNNIWGERSASAGSLWNQPPPQSSQTTAAATAASTLEGSWSSIGSKPQPTPPQTQTQVQRPPPVEDDKSYLVPTLSDSEDSDNKPSLSPSPPQPMPQAPKRVEPEPAAQLPQQLPAQQQQPAPAEDYSPLDFTQLVQKMTETEDPMAIDSLLQALDSKYEIDSIFMDTKRNKKKEQIVILSGIASLSKLFSIPNTTAHKQRALEWMFGLLQLIKANDIHHQAQLAVDTLKRVSEIVASEPSAKPIRDKIEYLVKLI